MPKSKLLSLSKRLRSLRKEAWLTQEELARRTEISVKYVQNLESENPSLLTLEGIASGLGISVSELLE